MELVYMVIDKDIELMESYIERQELENKKGRGVHQRKATPEEMAKMFD